MSIPTARTVDTTEIQRVAHAMIEVDRFIKDCKAESQDSRSKEEGRWISPEALTQVVAADPDKMKVAAVGFVKDPEIKKAGEERVQALQDQTEKEAKFYEKHPMQLHGGSSDPEDMNTPEGKAFGDANTKVSEADNSFNTLLDKRVNETNFNDGEKQIIRNGVERAFTVSGDTHQREAAKSQDENLGHGVSGVMKPVAEDKAVAK